MSFRRVSTGIVDQALSSGSNALVLIAVARVTTPDEFGETSLAFAALVAVMGTLRGLLGTRLTVLSSDPLQLRKEARFSLTASVAIGTLAGCGIALVGLTSGAGLSVLVLAATCPFVFAQDVTRYSTISIGRPSVACLADGVWFVSSALVLMSTVFFVGAVTGTVVVATWCVFSIISLSLLMIVGQVSPAFRGIGAWATTGVAQRIRFGLEAAVAAAASIVILGVVTALLGLHAAAAIRGAGTIMGPLNVLMSSLALALAPELAREGNPRSAQLWARLRLPTLGMAGFSIVIGIIAIVLPETIGREILGDTWDLSKQILPIMSVEYAALAWMGLASTALRVQSRSSDLLRIKIGYLVTAATASCLAALSGRVTMVSICLAGTAIFWAGVSRTRVLSEPRRPT